MENGQLTQIILAFVFTLSLLGLCAWLLSRFGGRIGLPKMAGAGSRLNVVEWKVLDHRHRLVLVKRDNTEHLLLLSATSQPVVIENNISTGSAT